VADGGWPMADGQLLSDSFFYHIKDFVYLLLHKFPLRENLNFSHRSTDRTLLSKFARHTAASTKPGSDRTTDRITDRIADRITDRITEKKKF